MLNTNTLKQYHDKTAVISSDGESYTYANLLTISSQIYSFINHRTLVFCLSKNEIGSLSGYISFITNKVVPLLLDASIDRQLLDNLINTYHPEYLWLPTDQLSEFPLGKEIFTILNYSLIKIGSESSFTLHDDLALLLTTSGSTGSPKLVRLNTQNIDANAISIANYLSIDEHERPITTLPMSYSYGLSIINSHLINGATLLLTSKTLMDREFWAFLKNQNATSISGVPYTYEILKKLRFFRMELPALKTLTQAGGKLNTELNKEFSEFCQQTNKHFVVMYGQTEATARMSYLPPQYSLTKLGSIGIAISGGEFSLIDETGSTIEGNEIAGELVYKGANVSMGYAECGEDLKKRDENRGALITGDLAKRDDENFYFIVGRKKRFIKIYGNRVNLDETERLLKNIVSDCACNGEDDNLVIYITDSSKESMVREFLSKKTGINIKAFSVKVIEKIPKNTSGKTIYSNLST